MERKIKRGAAAVVAMTFALLATPGAANAAEAPCNLPEGWCDVRSRVNIDPKKSVQTGLTCNSRARYVTSWTFTAFSGSGGVSWAVVSADHTRVTVLLENTDTRSKLLGELYWTCRNTLPANVSSS
ncbi:hypothetical protein [Acrocarpospora sp. B8E8]|uniref:hypothetical protein n=1 Tax=Acrocarpospora sp. B8E8 TaxID=3153572 RepID=UPI00325D27FE